MKTTAKFVCCTFALAILLQITALAEPQVQYIEYWKDGVACNSRNEIITDCTAYDYLSQNPDKFVSLDAAGKEITRLAAPNKPTEDAEHSTGTAALSAKVPESINNAVEVVLWDSKGNAYTLTAYKDNNYVAYTNIPTGTYSVFSAGIKDDFKGEYPAVCDKDEITIEPSSAAKLEVVISEKQDLTNPLTYLGKDGGKEGERASEPSTSENPESESITGIDAKSLLKSTIITLAALVALLLGYKLEVWYRNHHRNRG